MAKIWLKTKLQNLAMKKKEAYVTRSITLPRIDNDQLLERAAANSGIRRATVFSAAEAIFNEMENFLLNGHSIEVKPLGTFRFGINAKATDTEAEAGAGQVYRRKIHYRPAKDLWRKLQQVTLIDHEEEEPEPEPEP